MAKYVSKQGIKYDITARKHMGDDKYSWAVFVNGSPRYTGLSRNSVPYYKELVKEHLDTIK